MSNSSTLMPNQGDSFTGPSCQNCGAEQDSGEPVCRHCGYYAVLGRVIDLEEENQPGAHASHQTQQQTAWEIWSNLIPAWGWGLILCVLAVIAESVAGALMFEVGSSARTLWSLSQLSICALALVVVHVLAYVTLLMDDASAGLMDFILKPFECWKPVVSKLPRNFVRVAILAIAITGILMSLIVLRSLDYEKLLDWGVEPQAKPNLLGAVIAQAKKIEGKEKDLEGSLNALNDSIDEPEEEPEEVVKIDVDCVIVGYMVDKDNPSIMTGLVMAGDVKGKLKIVGIVSHNIPDDVREELNERLPKLVRPTPFVESNLRAFWVDPVIACRVKCVKQNRFGQLVEPDFDRLLTELSLGN